MLEPTWQQGDVALYLGDCLDVMCQMPDNSMDAITTDPPYGLEFMGKDWDRFSGGFSKNEDWEHGNLGGLPRQRYRNIKCPECDNWIYDHPPNNCTCGGVRRLQMRHYEEFGYRWAIEALRVAKPGAHLLAFGGTRTFHRLACAIEDAGWEIRDCVMWVYGSGFPKSHDVSKALDKMAGVEREVVGNYVARGYSEHSPTDDGRNMWAAGEVVDKPTAITIPATPAAVQWQGWGTALKPAWEPIIVARKPLDGTVAANVLTWGTGAINIDATRIATGDKLDGGAYAATGTPRNDGWGMQRAGAGIYRQPLGRWPANVTHDGSDEVLAGFPPSSITGNRRNGHRIQQEAVATPFTRGIDAPEYTDSGSAARFFYCAKASRQDRDEGLEGLDLRDVPYSEYRDAMKETDSWVSKYPDGSQRPMNPLRNGHPTVKPTNLMRWLCRLVTPPGGTVLDPFMGSGSTGKACVLEGFKFVGIDNESDYVEIAKRRIAHVLGQPQEMRLPGC